MVGTFYPENSTRKLLESLCNTAKESNAQLAKLSFELEGINGYGFEIKCIRRKKNGKKE